MATLSVGDVAPAFELPDQDGNAVSLAQFKGQKVIVYFYPRDDTPGCTKEACQFSDLLEEFAGHGATVLGISKDGADSHRRFREKFGLGVALLTDEDRSAMAAYGAWGEKQNYGKTIMGVIRSTFLIDESGRIARAWYNVRADGHAAKVLEALA